MLSAYNGTVVCKAHAAVRRSADMEHGGICHGTFTVMNVPTYRRRQGSVIEVLLDAQQYDPLMGDLLTHMWHMYT